MKIKESELRKIIQEELEGMKSEQEPLNEFFGKFSKNWWKEKGQDPGVEPDKIKSDKIEFDDFSDLEDAEWDEEYDQSPRLDEVSGDLKELQTLLLKGIKNNSRESLIRAITIVQGLLSQVGDIGEKAKTFNVSKPMSTIKGRYAE